MVLTFVVCLGFSMKSQAQTYISVGVNQPALLTASAGPDDLICPGDTALLGGSPSTTGGTAPFTFVWSPTTGVGNPGVPNTGASPAVSTIYTLTVKDGRNCTADDTIVVTVDTCVGMPDPNVPVEMALFPNPSDGNFTVLLSGDYAAKGILLITDPAGRVIRETQLENVQGEIRKEFHLNQVSRGTYLVQLKLEEGNLVRRVIIQ